MSEQARRLYPYPETLNVAQWQSYLGRKITDEEYSILAAVRDEKEYNRELIKLHNIVKDRALYIPMLTARNGNCLFESLQIIGLCEDHNNFRKYLAHMLYLFRDHKNLFRGDARSLFEMFNDTNEVEIVLCVEEQKLYKYTYETMCQDFASGYSWTRLPTQIILQFMSALMNIRFQIYSNLNDFVHVLDVNLPKDDPYVIFLGHIGEQHYVPLAIRIGREYENNCPRYDHAQRDFIMWADLMEQSMNNYYYPDDGKNEVVVSEKHDGYVEVTPEDDSNKDNQVNYE
ncbi:MAG: hypothetical protein Hyperionvirus8_16 [Hyperionvirus sp.]|uniref:OTU domain-containing protein n=1 Tax=Hyperionvirus sp. TaxID=2487770 RepID=A0A3G5A8X5_9VIRU|nr:MAG: hypothetical protein Hyperionvirus8_16 [Hyperionvirus sp.]